MCETVCIAALSMQGKSFGMVEILWYSEVLIQLPISILGRYPEEIYMSSKHLYGVIVVRALCWGAVTSNRGTNMFRVMQVILFLLVFLSGIMRQTAAVCPPWFIPDNSSRTGCSCNKSGEGVKCGKNSAI